MSQGKPIVFVAALCLLLLSVPALAETNLAKSHSASVSTGAFSGNGTWTMKAGSTDLTLDVTYDEKGRLTGNARIGAFEFPVLGKMKLTKKGLNFLFKSTDKSLAKLKAKGTVDGASKSFTGTATLQVSTLSIDERKAQCSGNIPPGSSDVLGLQLALTQEGAVLGGTVTVLSPSGKVYESGVKGKIKAKKAGEKVKLAATDKIIKMKGSVEGAVLEVIASTKLPGFKLKKLALSISLSDVPASEYAMILEGDLFDPFATSTSPLPVTGSLVDIDGAGFPPSISWSNGANGGFFPVGADGSFAGTIPLVQGDNQLGLGLPNADPLAMIEATHNPGFDFGGRLTLNPDVLYVGEQREITAMIAITDPNLDPDSVELVRAADGTSLVSLLDDGEHLVSGDDIEGDGIFTGRLAMTEPAVGSVGVRVAATHSGGTKVESEVFDIRVVEAPTPQKLAEIQTITEDCQSKLDAISDPSEIPAAVDQALADLQQEESVEEAGKSESGLGVWALFDTGILGVAYAPEFDVKGGGSRAGPVAAAPAGPELAEPAAGAYRSFYADRRLGLFGKTDDPNEIRSTKVFAIAAQWFDWKDNDDIPLMQKTLADHGCYEVTYKKYTSKGSGTIADWKNLGNFGIVLISSHGDSFFQNLTEKWKGTFKFNGAGGQVALHSNTALTQAVVDANVDDFIQGRLVFWGSNIGILPSFIQKYAGSMPNSWVYMSICRGTWNASMAQAFLAKGAGTFMGYSDYVAVSFCKTNGTKTLAELLKDDQNMSHAFTPGVKETDKDPAEYKLFGNKNLDIQKDGIENGGFEDPLAQAWTVQGDGRRIPALGAATPKEEKAMGIISTGLGFTTESGSISQVFCAPENADEIMFWWNFFSEEFLEFVGSEFQDTLEVFVENAEDGTSKTMLLMKTIDSTNANPGVSPVAISFDQDDVHATGWQKFTAPFPAALKGKPVKITFRVFDVGDSIYDTAVLIDDIQLSTTAP
ncbi:MAG: choice-of-anchor L domain-containing protein [Planctomycetota bacterium]